MKAQEAVELAAGSHETVAVFEKTRNDLLLQRRRKTVLLGAVFLAWFGTAAFIGELSPARLIHGFPRITEYIERILPQLGWTTLLPDIADWYYGFGKWFGLLIETMLMAFLATLLGTIGAFVLCFPASRSLTTHPILYFLTRRILEVARTVPDLVFALIFVFAFGLGPLAGILAIAIHTMGGSGKLFAEAVENIDMRQVEGVQATGGNWFQAIRYGAVPQVLPDFASYTLWRYEINVRTSSIIGFVGAGGIGQELYTAIRVQYYEDISAIILMLILTVALIDLTCESFRHHVIQGKWF